LGAFGADPSSEGLLWYKWKVGCSVGSVVDSKLGGCGGMMAETKVLLSEQLVAPCPGPKTVEAASKVSDWAIVIKGGKQVPLPVFSPSPMPLRGSAVWEWFGILSFGSY
jgi:hypothetical protein